VTQYLIPNYAMQTIAAPTAVTTGTAIKTMLQVATPSTNGFKVVRWGVRFSTAPTVPVTCELVETAAVAATVTAHVAAGVQPYDDASAGLASPLTLSTTGTGYTASAEGTVAAVRQADLWIAPIGVSQYDYEWSLGREFKIAPSKILRIRMTTTVAISALCWVVGEPI
jgi:hypothetical protein